MEVEAKGRKRFVLFNDKKKLAWLSPRPDVQGFREVSLQELDKLLPHAGHAWHVTANGGLTWRTDVEIAANKAEVEAKRKASKERRKAATEAKLVKKGESTAFAKLDLTYRSKIAALTEGRAMIREAKKASIPAKAKVEEEAKPQEPAKA